MKKLLLAIAIAATAACTTISTPNYRTLASTVVPTNVELIANLASPYTGETKTNAVYCSGVAISPTVILTAGHCVDAFLHQPAITEHELVAQNKLRIRTHDGRILVATIVKYAFKEGDKDTSRDVAMLTVEGLVDFAPVGDSDALRVGDQIAIVGNTFGELTYSFTVGVVSYLNRVMDVGVFLQTDALAGPGNSGGPVFNMDGELIGLLVRGGGGVSLVLPIKDVLKHLAE